MNVAIVEGGTATFTVTTTGGSPYYQWRRNGNNITSDCRISGTNTSTMVLKKARLSDSGDQFSVLVWNSKGTVTSQSATLTVTPAPLAGPFLYVNDENTVLARIDVRTGNMTPIGVMWFRLTDIAFTPEGTLYGISTNVLYRVNPETAVVSYIASHKVPGANALVCGSDGTLYAASGSTTYLYKINPATGVGEALGNTGFYSGGDLAFKEGKLYMTSSTGALVHIDLQTYRGTAVGSLGFSRAFGLAAGDDGVLYGVAGTNIFSVNTATGAGTLVSEFGGQCLGEIYGTAFLGEAGAVPARVLCNPKRAGNLMQLTLAGRLNQTYVIDRSTNLIDWTEITRVQATNAACSLQFATQPGAEREFFRARYATPQAPVGTLLALHFENTLADEDGHSPSTGSGVTYETGLSGAAARFGTTSQVLFPAANHINATNGTLMFWIKPLWNGNDGKTHTMLKFGDVGGLLFLKDGANNWRCIANRFSPGGTSEKDVALNISGEWSANQWHHAAFTWNRTSLKLYVDGQLRASTSINTLPEITTTTFQLGGDGAGLSAEAVIDELLILDHPMTAAEIQEEYRRFDSN